MGALTDKADPAAIGSCDILKFKDSFKYFRSARRRSLKAGRAIGGVEVATQRAVGKPLAITLLQRKNAPDPGARSNNATCAKFNLSRPDRAVPMPFKCHEFPVLIAEVRLVRPILSEPVFQE
ncbi:hypothetical protein EU805_16745 [Salipiger sp. IMCC34102]|uniref:hypothetical protein n=1 Tax=Salipiger sp. IMCC34102 TaxID=2510647 RepID=UPI00101DECEF|nr:hypothetical protein [Salipiger sp. IMCC34102]RYH00765.1 hypothetical protein EU805_16745 [Salipiger sp. IMCC34102]